MRSGKRKCKKYQQGKQTERKKKLKTPQNDKNINRQYFYQNVVSKYPTCNRSQRYIRNNANYN